MFHHAELFLEHWVGNIPLFEDMEIPFSVDTLEVYGLTCFQIRGGAQALSIYFRPMSLERAKAGETDISPELDVDSIAVCVNGEPVSLGTLSAVTEFYPSSREGDPKTIKGYFLMTTFPASGLKEADNRLDIRIKDPGTGAIGCAGLYFDPLKL